jgi:hypothetical protein
MNAVNWVLLDSSSGAATQDGSRIVPLVLDQIAEVVQDQVNQEFAAEWGGKATIRAGASENIKPGEWVYGFVPTLPEAPGASSYHDISGKGVPFALCAVTTCGSLLGPMGLSVDVSHEILETAGDKDANHFANDNKGLMHAVEMCDAVELQTYGKTCKDGTVVQVSNWLLRSWFTPGEVGPYDYMTLAKIPGAVSPPGPLITAPGHGGNYQIISKWGGDKKVFAAGNHIVGTRRKGNNPHWSSRAGRRLKQIERLARIAEAV